MKNQGLPEQIAKNIISDYIIPNRLMPGDKLPTARQLQQKFEVSTSTVSAAFSFLEEQGVLTRKHGSGCFLARLPQYPPQPGKTCQRIGFIHPGTTNHPNIKNLHTGISSACKMHRIKLISQKVKTYAAEKKAAKKIAESGVDALVIRPMPRTVKQHRKDYLASEFLDIPIILTDLSHPAQMRTNVIFDNYQLGFEITHNLLKEGHRNIAFSKLKNKDQEIYYRSNNDRYQGYLDALRSRGITPLPELCWAKELSTYPESGETIGQAFIDDFKKKAKSQRPTAIICLEDPHAASLIKCAVKNGIRVPEDLKIIGFDNNPKAHKTAGIPFPTTCPDFAKLGTLAVNLAVREIYTPSSTPLNYVLPVELNWV